MVTEYGVPWLQSLAHPEPRSHHFFLALPFAYQCPLHRPALLQSLPVTASPAQRRVPDLPYAASVNTPTERIELTRIAQSNHQSLPASHQQPSSEPPSCLLYYLPAYRPFSQSFPFPFSGQQVDGIKCRRTTPFTSKWLPEGIWHQLVPRLHILPTLPHHCSSFLHRCSPTWIALSTNSQPLPNTSSPRPVFRRP